MYQDMYAGLMNILSSFLGIKMKHYRQNINISIFKLLLNSNHIKKRGTHVLIDLRVEQHRQIVSLVVLYTVYEKCLLRCIVSDVSWARWVSQVFPATPAVSHHCHQSFANTERQITMPMANVKHQNVVFNIYK